MCGCGSVVEADFAERKRLGFFADVRFARWFQEIDAFAVANYDSSAIRFNEESRFLIDGNFAGRDRPAILHDASEEAEGTAHAIALGEVRIGEQIFKVRNFEKTANQRNALEVGIGEHVGGGKVIVVGLVAERAVAWSPPEMKSTSAWRMISATAGSSAAARSGRMSVETEFSLQSLLM